MLIDTALYAVSSMVGWIQGWFGPLPLEVMDNSYELVELSEGLAAQMPGLGLIIPFDNIVPFLQVWIALFFTMLVVAMVRYVASLFGWNLGAR